MKFDFDDIILKPSVQSRFNSRSKIDPYIDGKLPLIGAPMDTVFTTKNKYENNRNFINLMPICLPRMSDEDLKDNIKGVYKLFRKWHRGSLGFMKIGHDEEYKFDIHFYLHNFLSVSLSQFNCLIRDNPHFNVLMRDYQFHFKILIDIANGHMKGLEESIIEFREEHGNATELMVGNIANPETYKVLSDAGADYIRCSVGSGSVCTTSANVAVGYPMASLIGECYDLSMNMNRPAKIVADGGFKDYSDIIKALALGADYVMVGSILNKSVEANAPVYWKNIRIPSSWKPTLFRWGFDLCHEYRGMSTKAVQRSWGKKELTTSEGIVKRNKIEYNINGWTSNFTDYLRSAMSYCNSENLEEFKINAEYERITNHAHKRFDK